MPKTEGGLVAPAIILTLFVLLILALSTSDSSAWGKGEVRAFLPLVMVSLPGSTSFCPYTSGGPYGGSEANRVEGDDPVRPAERHADKNLAMRGYIANTDPDIIRGLVDYGSYDGQYPKPPQFATLFNPPRVPSLVEFYRVYDWVWQSSPQTGYRGAPLPTNPQHPYRVTALGLGTTPGEELCVPDSGYTIGGGYEVLVLYADQDTICLRYGREDGWPNPSYGYQIHIDKICVDPELLARYEALDHPTGTAEEPGGPRYDRSYSTYNLPALKAGEAFGTAGGTEVVIAIADTGSFMDPRSCREWWYDKYGYSVSCPWWGGKGTLREALAAYKSGMDLMPAVMP